MANALLRGFMGAREHRMREREAKQLEEQRRIENEKSRFDLGQDNVKAVREQRAYEANREVYGDVAGNPTATGQLEGIAQRQELFPFKMREAEVGADASEMELLNKTTTNALLFTKQATDNGKSATEALSSLPQQYRQAVGLDDAKIAELGAAIDAEPAMLDAMLAGLKGSPKSGGSQAAPKIGVAPDGQKRYFTGPVDNPTWGPAAPDKVYAPQAQGSTFYARTESGVTPIASISGSLTEGERAKKAGGAVGKAQGEIEADDLMLSQRASNVMADTVRSEKMKTARLSGVIDRAVDDVDWGSAGTVADLKMIGGSGPANLQATLNTIQANAAFDRLMAIKTDARNTTGGALGQVSERELDLLRDAEFSLTQKQTPAQLRDNLQRYKAQLQKVNELFERAYERDIAAGLVRPESKLPTTETLPEGEDFSVFPQDVQSILDRY